MNITKRDLEITQRVLQIMINKTSDHYEIDSRSIMVAFSDRIKFALLAGDALITTFDKESWKTEGKSSETEFSREEIFIAQGVMEGLVKASVNLYKAKPEVIIIGFREEEKFLLQVKDHVRANFDAQSFSGAYKKASTTAISTKDVVSKAKREYDRQRYN